MTARFFKWTLYLAVSVLTTVPGLFLQVGSLGAFDYIDKMERLQGWAEKGSRPSGYGVTFGKAKGQTMWDKIKDWFKHSLTIMWARIVAFGGLLLAMVEGLIANPDINGAVQQALQPRFIPYYVIAIGLITELCRRRTVGRATDEDNQIVRN